MVPIARNYDPTDYAIIEMCDFESCAGCSIPFACNYDPALQYVVLELRFHELWRLLGLVCVYMTSQRKSQRPPCAFTSKTPWVNAGIA